MLLKKLGIELPIIQAPMAGVSTPAMAAAVSNCGALGSIGIGAADVQTATKMIVETRSLTERPFNVNVFCHKAAVSNSEIEAAWLNALTPYFSKFGAEAPPLLAENYKSFVGHDEMLEQLLELSPRVVSFTFGLPCETAIKRLKNAGIVLLGTATNLNEAQQIERAGVDAVVAQGYEAGGHRGVFDPSAPDDCLSVIPLTRILVHNLKIPVIAAGSIMDGAGIAAALKLGAEAAQIGTAFIACSESSADKFYRAALHSDSALHTVMSAAISGRPARSLRNPFTAIAETLSKETVPDYPIAYAASKALDQAAKKAGQGGFGAQLAGQGASLIREMPAAYLVRLLQNELEQTLSAD